MAHKMTEMKIHLVKPVEKERKRDRGREGKGVVSRVREVDRETVEFFSQREIKGGGK